LICCEEVNFITIGFCNHQVVCLKCCLKMRSLQKNIKCIYCNDELSQVAVIDDENIKWEDVYLNM